MSYTAGVLLLVGALAILTAVTLQVLQYRRGVHIITRGQLVLRLVTAALVLGVIGLIFFGVLHPWSGPLQELEFWMVLTVVAVIVIFLALADLRILERQRHIHQAQLYRQMQHIQDLAGRPPAPAPDGEQTPPEEEKA
jgi:hypothetical protein